MGVIIACTRNENPIKPIEPAPHQFIRGSVILENQTNYAHCPVVLDSLNIGTLTDSSGSYEIFLPDSLAGVTGKFNIYFYLYDYELDSLVVIIKNGKVLWSAADVLDDGTLKTFTLKQLLSIDVTSEKSHYKVGEHAKFHYRLTNTSNRTFSTTPNTTAILYDIILKRMEWFVTQDPVHSQTPVEPNCSYFSGEELKFKAQTKGYLLVYFPIIYEHQDPFYFRSRQIPSSLILFLSQIEMKYQDVIYDGYSFFVFIHDPKNLHYPFIEIIE